MSMLLPGSSGSTATRVRQRSQRDVQGVRLRSHDADVLVYDSWHTKIYFLTCDGRCHILRRCSKEKQRRSLLACCQLPSPPRRQLHVEVGARPHLLPSGLGARQRDPVMDLPCPSPRKPRPSRSQRHVRQRQHLLLPPLSKQLEPLKQRRLIQVQLHCLQQQQFLSRHPRAARHSPWCRTLPIRALLAHPARVQQQARSAILPVIFVPQVPS
mmetsp:Transcript_25952/g.38130  ORF Transcript_25952/g.38130 Transcript_25952/m.38130 type:complete len:212 (-) Transcript_25952:190-825(-)